MIRIPRKQRALFASLLLFAATCLQPSSLLYAQYDFQTPRVDVPEELPEHPRLFLNPAEIVRLKAWIAREPWLKKQIDRMVTRLEKTVENPPLPNKNKSGAKKTAKLAHEYALVYVLRGDRRYAEAAAKILRGNVKHFPGYVISTMKGKATGDALAECDWAVDSAGAYDLIYQSGVLSEKDKQEIEQVFKASGEVLRRCNHAFRSNWRARAVAGIGVLGFCINDRSLIEESLHGHHDATGRLRRDGFVQHVAWSILADGVFYERSMHYHLYVADAYALLAEAARHSDIDLWNLKVLGHPLDAGTDIERKFGKTGSKTMKAIFDSPFYEAFSDGSLVRLGNSYSDRLERKRCYEAAYRAYRDPKYAWVLNRPVQFYRPIAGGGYMTKKELAGARREAKELASLGDARRVLNPTELIWMVPDLPAGEFDLSKDTRVGVTGRHENFCTLLPNGGITVLRESADKNAVGVQMTFGDWGSAHTHPELLAIALAAKQKQMVTEVRYHHYGHKSFLNWDRQTIAHNTVTVDETSQYPQDGSDDRWAVERGGKQARCKPVFFHPGKNLKAFRATCDAAYRGVVLDRTVVLLGDVVIDFYRCRSDQEHQYDYALHIDGTPSEHPRLSDSSLRGPVSKSLGYLHMVDVRRGQLGGELSSIMYLHPSKQLRLRLEMLSLMDTELITAQGHADLKGRSKNVLLLRARGKNADFVNVLSFPEGRRHQTRQLDDTPDGVLGVVLKQPDGTKDILLSADKPHTFRYAGHELSGQLVLLRKTRGGPVRVIATVP